MKKKTKKESTGLLVSLVDSIKTSIQTSFRKNRTRNSNIVTNGIFVTCILLSLASGFIDLVFFSGLSKSIFHIGNFAVTARVIYLVISIGLISGKFWCAEKIGMLKELRTRLKAEGISWYKAMTKAMIPWQAVHKFLILISIITALSLSVNSIGTGIRVMEQNITNMTTDANNLIELNASISENNKDKREAAKDTIMSTKTAQDTAKAEVEKYWTLLDGYQTRIRAIRADEELDDEEKTTQIDKLKKEAVASLPIVSSSNVEYLSRPEFEKKFSEITKGNEIIDSSSVYEEAIAYDTNQVESTIRALIDKGYTYPDGTPIVFETEDGGIVNIQLAISRLQTGIARWQADTGDVGESSKIFTLLSVYIAAPEIAGGMGSSELMMMILIAVVGIVQEFLIALFTPKATIDRKALGQVSQYTQWVSIEEKERFLLSVYIFYYSDGVITKEEKEALCRECVANMEDTREDIIARYSKRKAPIQSAPKTESEKPLLEEPTIQPAGFSTKVDDLIADLTSMTDSLKEL